MRNLPDPLAPLEENRRELFTTLDLLDGTREPVARADLASELVGICSRYEDVKERVIYPALRVISAEGHEIDRAEEDQQAVRDALSEIRTRTKRIKPAYVYLDNPERFEEVLIGLITAVRAHVEHEDEALLPMLAELDAQTGEELHRNVSHAVAHASTHPHPRTTFLGRAIQAIDEKFERDFKDESTAHHPGVDMLNEELARPTTAHNV